MNPNENATTGLKFDTDKPRMDLLDTNFLVGVAEVLTFGAKKYAAHNWRKGIEVSRSIAGAMRHITSFNSGENLDPESGKSHLYHAACCLMFAQGMLDSMPEKDDRFIATRDDIKSIHKAERASVKVILDIKGLLPGRHPYGGYLAVLSSGKKVGISKGLLHNINSLKVVDSDIKVVEASFDHLADCYFAIGERD